MLDAEYEGNLEGGEMLIDDGETVHHSIFVFRKALTGSACGPHIPLHRLYEHIKHKSEKSNC